MLEVYISLFSRGLYEILSFTYVFEKFNSLTFYRFLFHRLHVRYCKPIKIKHFFEVHLVTY